MEFNKKFSKFSKNFGLLCIVQYVGEKNSYRFTIHENVHFLEIYTKSESNGVEFIDPQDNIFLDKIIMSTYKFSLNDLPPLPVINEEETEQPEDESTP
jgi:hypothetical protein